MTKRKTTQQRRQRPNAPLSSAFINKFACEAKVRTIIMQTILENASKAGTHPPIPLPERRKNRYNIMGDTIVSFLWMKMMILLILGMTTSWSSSRRSFLQPSHAWSTGTVSSSILSGRPTRTTLTRTTADRQWTGRASLLFSLSSSSSAGKESLSSTSSSSSWNDRNNDGRKQNYSGTMNGKKYLSRRKTLQSIVASGTAAAAVNLRFVEPARARNLPTSTGADTSQTGTVQALRPIVALRQSLERIQVQRTLLASSRTTTTSKTPTKNDTEGNNNNNISFLLTSIPQKEKEFKRLFDAYSDRVSYKQTFMDQNAFLVYYTKGFDGPGRPTLEEGESVENERQTLQFGARNDAWIAWQECLIEYQFLKKDGNDEDDNDFDSQLAKTIQAVDTYLSLAPPQDFKQAKEGM